jgi:hypothetical protein
MGCEVCLSGSYSNCPVCSEDEPEIKEAEASTVLSVYVNCPHCDNYQDVSDGVVEHLDSDLKADNLDIVIKCDNKNCKEKFIITKSNY